MVEFVFKLNAPFKGYSNPRPLIFILRDLIRQMWSGDHEVVDPNQFRSKISRLFKDQFKDWEQSDSAELFSSVIDCLHEELLELQDNQIKSFESNYLTFEDYLKNNNTFIVQTFYVFQSFQVICECGHIINEEKQTFLILNLPQNDNRRTISLFLFEKDKSLYKIELKLAKNPVQVIDLLREAIQRGRRNQIWMRII